MCSNLLHRWSSCKSFLRAAAKISRRAMDPNEARPFTRPHRRAKLPVALFVTQRLQRLYPHGPHRRDQRGQ
jgi:hypothetical protein